MTIRLCCRLVAVAKDGPKRTGGSTNVIAGDQRVFMAKPRPWHGLARAVRRGLANMKIQAYLTAAAINLKQLAATLLAILCAGLFLRTHSWSTVCARVSAST